MGETSHEPVMAWQFLRRHFVRIVIGAVLMASVYGVVRVYATYQREQRIAKEIEAYGGFISWQYFGPDWIPKSMRDRMTLFSRVTVVRLYNRRVNDAGVEHLKGLTKLMNLYLNNTQVTDASLEHLKGLTTLTELHVSGTQVTDAGLEHLKGLTNLKYLYLNDAQVTAEGRAMIRKALPNYCKIVPDP